jgi:hypothetical protein
MNFTPQELKLIERMRRDERRWPRSRWAIVAAGVLLAADSTFGLVACCVTDFGDDAQFQLALLLPTSLLMAGFAAGLIAWAIRDWHGEVKRMLLPRLLDAQQNQTAKHETVA